MSRTTELYRSEVHSGDVMVNYDKPSVSPPGYTEEVRREGCVSEFW